MEDLGPTLKNLLENVLRIWPAEARWKESDLVFNTRYPPTSEVSVLPVSESAVDEGGQAAGEDDEEVVCVESEAVDGKHCTHLYKNEDDKFSSLLAALVLPIHFTMDIRGYAVFFV